MNEHIRRLALEARLGPALLLHHYGKVDALTDTEQEGLEQIEKFAELIVRECAQEAYDCAKQFRNDEHYRVDNLWPQFERVCNAVGDDIKIKFGVEE